MYTPTDTYHIIDDIVQLVTATAALSAAALGLVNRRKIRRVHNDVNGAAQRQVARVDQLSQSLQQAGIDIPLRPENASTTPAGPETPAAPSGA